MYTSQSKSKVKNKQAAPIQITAEQIMREAAERQESKYEPPKQQIHDPEELEHYKTTKRKSHEDAIRRNQHHIGNWIKYAKFEEEHGELKRARSIYERAIVIDSRNVLLWLKYADMEMKNKSINRARNIWNRAVMLLPRVDQFWLKYILMEESVGNYAGVRQVYERWMDWAPAARAWRTYINFEIKFGEINRAREIFQRFVQIHPQQESWIKFAKFEHKHGDVDRVREVYQNALDYMGLDHIAECEELLIRFAEFEIMVKEFDRARAIYKYALDHIPKAQAKKLYKTFIQFEKQFGDKVGIEEVITNKRRFQYEEDIKQNPKNYDVWFDYIRLEELNGEKEKIREVYERAIANVPPMEEKRFWRRYIYLWINYAVFEEMEKNFHKAREVFREVIKLIPHKQFSFSKIWILYAHFEIRREDLQAARLVFGQAIGQASKSKVFLAYIDMEWQLGEFDRVRKLYEKWLTLYPHECDAWCRYAKVEISLEETERARAIYSAAISQPLLDMPELVWKDYIDFEITEENFDHVRSLYEQLLDRTQHVRVWISYAEFEYSADEISKARAIYDRAYQALRNAENKEERVLLVESWLDFEKQLDDPVTIAEVTKKLPKREHRERIIKSEDGASEGIEEYYEYVFPDEMASDPNQVLAIAQRWKKRKLAEKESATD